MKANSTPSRAIRSSFAVLLLAAVAIAAKPPALEYPPTLKDGTTAGTTNDPSLIAPTTKLADGVAIAKTAPTVDVIVYPGQQYPGEPWSNWGDGSVAGGVYYSAIGDHLAIGVKGDGRHGTGAAIVYAYDPAAKSLRPICNTTDVLKQPAGRYTPGKIHSRIELGGDGWLYFATHRGSEKATTDANRYAGDWIIRTNPATGESEVVALCPVAKHSIPTSVLDADRMIFYGGTAAGLDSGDNADAIEFIAYDLSNRKLLYRGPDGPSRAIMLARSTGRVYYTAGNTGKTDGATLMRYHPDENGGKPLKIADNAPGLRAATDETPDGLIYAVSQKGPVGSTLWSLNTKTDAVTVLGPAAVGEPTYITSIDADPTGRYLYYVPGAHGQSPKGGAAVVQYDTKTRTKKAIAFLHPHFEREYGLTLLGTFSSALSADGGTLFITWNATRDPKRWDCCVLTAVHIPESERPTDRPASLRPDTSAITTSPTASDSPAAPVLRFEDVAEQTGLRAALAGRMVHGLGWGDIDGDGYDDIYAATFAQKGGGPNVLLRNADRGARFEPLDQPAVQAAMRGTGVVFADLDNDGDLDLYVASMPKPDHADGPLAGCRLYRNDGRGAFTDSSVDSGACPEAFGGRSACVTDYDGDGLLDLLVGEEPTTGYSGSPTRSSRLLRNLGGLRFADASRSVGIPDGIPGRGVAAGDVNGDGWPDLFIASNDGGNVLLINDRAGRFAEPPGSRDTFRWPHAGGDDMICGVTIADVNADGRLDILIAQHFDHPWREPIANRLYLNRGVDVDDIRRTPRFEDVTDRVGLVGIPMKAPHIEVQDFDNDGLADIYASVVLFDGDTPHPLIFRQTDSRDGLPTFEAAALRVNEFPTAADLAVKSSAKFFDKMIADRRVFYAAPGPAADFDRDGRLDLLLGSWWPQAPSMLLANRTPPRRWLDVTVRGSGGVNRMGVGSRVNVYEPGRVGQPDALIGSREIAVGFGYASGQPAVAHFGLGERPAVDVEVVLPHGRGRILRARVEADQRIELSRD